MLVHNAVDYLATAEAGDSLMQSVINSDVCAKWINLYDYALDTLSANSDIKDVMDTADKYGYGEWGIVDSTTTPPTWGPLGNVPIMTANNAPYGTAICNSNVSGNEAYKAFDGNTNTYFASNILGTGAGAYVGYQFPVPVNIKKATATFYNNNASCVLKLQYSDDGTTFTDAGDNTTVAIDGNPHDIEGTESGYHMYWVVYKVSSTIEDRLAIHTLQFYGREFKPLVPTMTSNTTPKGTASASSELIQTARYYAYAGFLCENSNYWCPNENQGLNSWIKYASDAQFKLKMVRLGTKKVGSTSEYRIHKVRIYGVDNNVETAIGSEITLANGYNAYSDWWVFNVPIESSNIYGSYKMLITEITSNTTYAAFTGMTAIQYFGMDYSEKEFAPGSTRKTIYDHGVEVVALDTSVVTGGASVVKESNQFVCHVVTGGQNSYLAVNNNAILIEQDNLYMKLGNKAYRSDNAAQCGLLVIFDSKVYSYSDASHQKGYKNIPKQSQGSIVYSLDISAFKQSQMYVGLADSTSGVNTNLSCTEIWLE